MNVFRGSSLFSLMCILVAQSALAPAFLFSADQKRVPLFGTNSGIYALEKDGKATPLWTDGGVQKIVHFGNLHYALGDRGIVASSDLVSWEYRNEGLPVKVLKRYDGVRKSFDRVVQELKDLEANPANPNMMVTAVKDSVYLSRDGGKTWKNLGFPIRTNGVKAVAVASMPETVVFVASSIYGIYYIEPDRKGAGWVQLNAGLDLLETTKNPDEISDLLVVPGAVPTVWASQTFKASVFRLDWPLRKFERVWTDGKELGSVDSLDYIPGPNGAPGALRFVRDGSISELPLFQPNAAVVGDRPDLDALVGRAGKSVGQPINCLLTDDVRLSELWLLPSAYPTQSSRTVSARGKEGLYLPVNHAADPKQLAPYLDIVNKRGLNMIVVDMKDDVGRLRFTPKNPAVKAKSRVFSPVDVEAFTSTLNARGIWKVARIVVFKDAELARWNGGKYAVWDAKKNAPWQGVKLVKKKAEPPVTEETTVFEPYDEHWVDPYSEEVWDYTVSICRELVERGFDEIQFDYIRFPTDGENLYDARYRWRDPGMDMESAILSFLGYARSKISAPISVDIYGANGWYRTGSRTGQEVELLSHYVDAICPMYYPSHFEQGFLATNPEDQRPYRIYYRGTLRTERIAKSRIVVRPYIQSFYLNVSYDRKYYGADYVKLQVQGVRAAGAPGLTYWNNVGRYDEIPMPVQRPAVGKAADRVSPLLD